MIEEWSQVARREYDAVRCLREDTVRGVVRAAVDTVKQRGGRREQRARARGHGRAGRLAAGRARAAQHGAAAGRRGRGGLAGRPTAAAALHHRQHPGAETPAFDAAAAASSFGPFPISKGARYLWYVFLLA